MRVAVIGGGAAGMTTAWLLDGVHDVTVFEREPVLGGHVRTLGANVPLHGVPALDAGVIEFEWSSFPLFRALAAELDIGFREVPGTTALFLPSGRVYRSPANARASAPSRRWLLREHLRGLGLRVRRRGLRWVVRIADAEDLYERALSRFLWPSELSLWMRALLTYAYSTPFAGTLAMPAALAVPTLQRFCHSRTRWVGVRGGAYSYLQRIVDQSRAEWVLDARIEAVRRDAGGVEIVESGRARRFDAVVFAATPDQVLALLSDPSDGERAWFGAWSSTEVHTVLHTDTSLYERRGATYFSEFDLFVHPDGSGGYNAYLNRLCGLGDEVPYCLALFMEREIDPTHVVHVQRHVTPTYTVPALAHRRQVRRANGQRRTWHAGAWLWDGLHEGAVRSAQEVARGLGGRELRVRG